MWREKLSKEAEERLAPLLPMSGREMTFKAGTNRANAKMLD